MNDKYNQSKNNANINKHGLSFETIDEFNWETAITKEDNRSDYGERRFISYGYIKDRLHVLVWTIRSGLPRPISFRKANQRE